MREDPVKMAWAERRNSPACSLARLDPVAVERPEDQGRRKKPPARFCRPDGHATRPEALLWRDRRTTAAGLRCFCESARNAAFVRPDVPRALIPQP